MGICHAVAGGASGTRRREYDPFGNIRTERGTAASDFGYADEQRDSVTGPDRSSPIKAALGVLSERELNLRAAMSGAYWSAGGG